MEVNHEKQCFKCKNILPLNEFYKYKKMSDGHLNKCKMCSKNDSKLREEELRLVPIWVENKKLRQREIYHRLNYKEKYKKPKEKKKLSAVNYYSKYPEKYKAKLACTKRFKKIKGYEYHHWSYKEEYLLDVISLEINTHYLLHRNVIYNKEKMCYETKNNILLDTKQKHLDFINTLIK